MVTNGLSFSGAPSPWELFENASGPLKAPSGRFHFSWPRFWRWNWKDVGSLGGHSLLVRGPTELEVKPFPCLRACFCCSHSVGCVTPKSTGVSHHTWFCWSILLSPMVFSPSIEQSVPFAMNNLSPCSNFSPFYLEIEELAVHTCEFNICSLVPAQTFLPLGESFFPLGLPRCCWHSQSPVSTLLCELVVQGRANGYSFTQPTQKPMPRDQRNLEQLKLFIEIAQRMLKI